MAAAIRRPGTPKVLGERAEVEDAVLGGQVGWGETPGGEGAIGLVHDQQRARGHPARERPHGLVREDLAGRVVGGAEECQPRAGGADAAGEALHREAEVGAGAPHLVDTAAVQACRPVVLAEGGTADHDWLSRTHPAPGDPVDQSRAPRAEEDPLGPGIPALGQEGPHPPRGRVGIGSQRRPGHRVQHGLVREVGVHIRAEVGGEGRVSSRTLVAGAAMELRLDVGEVGVGQGGPPAHLRRASMARMMPAPSQAARRIRTPALWISSAPGSAPPAFRV